MFRFQSFQNSLLTSYLALIMLSIVWVLVVVFGTVYFGQDMNWFLLPSLFFVVVSFYLSWHFAQNLSKNLHELAEIASTIAEGDLTRRIVTESEDEVAEVARAFNRMVNDLSTIILNIKSNAIQLSENSKGLYGLSREINEGNNFSAKRMEDISVSAETQTRLIAENATALRKVKQFAGQIHHGAEATYQVSKEVQLQAEEGSLMAENAQAGITNSATQIKEAIRLMKGFNMGLKRIGDLVKRINTIAEQTHILAINATIEAKRAGDAGIGFSVIAHEVRRLSDEVRSFSGEITGLSGEILSDAQAVVETIERGGELLDRSRTGVGRSGEAHKSVAGRTTAVFERVREIYQLTQEQGLNNDMMVRTMDDVSSAAQVNMARTLEARDMIQRQKSSTEDLVNRSERLADLARQLESLVAEFRMPKAALSGERAPAQSQPPPA